MSNVAQPAGTQRAAIFLMSLGEEDAAQILRHMDAEEVQQLGSAMTELGSVSRDQLEAVVGEFNESVETHTALGVGVDEYVRRLLTTALGPKRARTLLDRILKRTDNVGLEALQWMEIRTIAAMMEGEHPQIAAIILAHLDSDRAAQLMADMDDVRRNEVFMRIASLDDIQDSALQELQAVMARHAEPGSGGKSSAVGGLKVAAEILSGLDAESGEAIIGFVRDADAEMGERIEEMMFSFEMLLQIDDRGMQALLREVSSETLTVALKGAEPEIQDKIFNNMSKRAAELLRDDLDVRGPTRLSEVEAAQKEILGVAKKLADDGTIMLGGKGEEFV